MKTTVVGAVILAAVATTTVVIQHQVKPHDSDPSVQAVSWDRASFANAGYQTPQATLKTMLWAVSNADTDSFLACCTPEARANREKQWKGKSKAVLSEEAKKMLDEVTGIKIVDQITVSSDQAVVTVLFEGTGKIEKMPFKKIGNDWKLAR